MRPTREEKYLFSRVGSRKDTRLEQQGPVISRDEVYFIEIFDVEKIIVATARPLRAIKQLQNGMA